MLLVTIGYNAEKAGLVGSNWASKTNALADENGLLEDVNTSFTSACPRQYAAQLIYNTVFAPTVVWRDDAYQHTNVLDKDNQTCRRKRNMNLVKETAGVLYACSEVEGKDYYQQVFTVWSETWVYDYDISVAFQDPSAVPNGTRIVNMDNQDVTLLLRKEPETATPLNSRCCTPRNPSRTKVAASSLHCPPPWRSMPPCMPSARRRISTATCKIISATWITMYVWMWLLSATIMTVRTPTRMRPR